jgi:pyruvate,water dikinase
MTATPATFEHAFENPEDANLSWTFDPMHYFEPLPRLTQDALRVVHGRALGSRLLFANGYAYMSGGDMPMDREVFRKGAVRIWEDDYVPAMSAFCRQVRDADYLAMPGTEIAAALARILEGAGEIYRYTFTVIPGYMPQTLALLDYAEEKLGSDGAVLVGALLQSGTNGTADAAAGLAELTELARAVPALALALRECAFASLADVDGGAPFLERLTAYLDEYGWRSPDWSAIHVPTWAEDHSRPLALIAGYLRDEETSPRAALERANAQRSEAERSVRERLTGEEGERFWQLFEAASPHVAMSENRAFWQLTIVGSLRPPIMALGRKLVEAGAIDGPGDIFHLGLDEVSEALAQPTDRRQAVREREAELAGWRSLKPPPYLGRPPTMAQVPPQAASMFTRFFGGEVVQPKDHRVVKGNPASKGVVRGTARVICDLADGGSLQPGEVLVCVTTAPPWTPLFAIASAVVVDTGGVLSHSAICAREFGIPCVAGTRIGTSTIPDGATITVDGAAGTVTIEG